MTFIYLLMGLEVIIVLVVTYFLIKKIRGVIKERRNRKKGQF